MIDLRDIEFAEISSEYRRRRKARIRAGVGKGRRRMSGGLVGAGDNGQAAAQGGWLVGSRQIRFSGARKNVFCALAQNRRHAW